MTVQELKTIIDDQRDSWLVEDQQSISDWANASFGSGGGDIGVAIRANEEMAELLSCFRHAEASGSALIEAADVVIVLMRIFSRNDVDFWDVIRYKMRINRGREWKVDGTGHGYHVKDGGKSA